MFKLLQNLVLMSRALLMCKPQDLKTRWELGVFLPSLEIARDIVFVITIWYVSVHYPFLLFLLLSAHLLVRFSLVSVTTLKDTTIALVFASKFRIVTLTCITLLLDVSILTLTLSSKHYVLGSMYAVGLLFYWFYQLPYYYCTCHKELATSLQVANASIPNTAPIVEITF